MKTKNPEVAKAEAEIETSLRTLVKEYGVPMFQRVTNRYLKAIHAERKATKQIAALEEELRDLREKHPLVKITR